jgi:hypothetical protein
LVDGNGVFLGFEGLWKVDLQEGVVLVFFAEEEVLVDELQLAYLALLSHLFSQLGVALLVSGCFAEDQTAKHPLSKQIPSLVVVCFLQQLHLKAVL